MIRINDQIENNPEGTMNRYDLKNAVDKVDGYFFPKPEQQVGCKGGLEAAFMSAQAECLHQLQVQMDNVRALTFEQFAAAKKLTGITVKV